MYSVVFIGFTSEPDLILRMHLSVHKEFNFIKLNNLEIVWIFFFFNLMSGTVPCSFLGHSPLAPAFFCSFSSPGLAEKSANRNSL